MIQSMLFYSDEKIFKRSFKDISHRCPDPSNDLYLLVQPVLV